MYSSRDFNGVITIAILAMLLFSSVDSDSFGPVSGSPSSCKNFCAVVLCLAVFPEDCKAQNKDYEPKSGECGCCPACTDFLDVNDECGVSHPDYPQNGQPKVIRHCNPATSECLFNHEKNKYFCIAKPKNVKVEEKVFVQVVKNIDAEK